MILTFTFSLNPETNEAAFAGNIEIQQALNILQGIVIADAVNKAQLVQAETRQKGKKDVKVKEEDGKG